jgi:DNA adenine methylase
VQIECSDALAVIRRFDAPTTLFYVDPPYVLATRCERWGRGYRHEYRDGDHRELASVLHDLEGMVVLSGYESDLYDELYAGWARVTRRVQTLSPRSATEVLWLSPSAAAHGRQLTLLEVPA